jgi:hypothetical protein
MLSEEVTIGIYPDGELNDVLIVPDGHEYHLFLTHSNNNYITIERNLNLGSIVIVNSDWKYEGDKLSKQSQTEIANYIMCYPGPETGYQTSI